ncbi:RNA 2',3'-cyclic phosphodiesterase [Rossellomorea aquimaris]|uniref:RNA 2',3'-cyclic phosphodiesterase n=1 Tax=Rossellomorea aquimaris TaxID=189382 RepID=A0A1J6WRN8_9BACI|nr:RNA 2',3'-cyclic phosphodiesterase [Rossellomorea aquimaris]OIU70899.1 2'-5' RNA ligase [Rossellomorea aquimaris]
MLKTHYFFACSLPGEMKKEIERLTAPMKEEDSFKKYVHPEDYHITLAFLGDASHEDLDAAIDHVTESLHKLGSFPLSLKRFGTFGKSDEPRIFWMGVNPSSTLHQIREKVYEACEEAGFQLETRPFTPHITVGRKWNKPSPFSKEWLSGFNPEATPAHLVNEVVLYRTHMDRTPKYEAVHTIHFNESS